MKATPCPACAHVSVVPYGVRFWRLLLRRSDLFVCLVCEARVNYDKGRTWKPAETFIGPEQM